MAKFAIFLIASIFLASAYANLTAEEQWTSFKLNHKKMYSKVEEKYRFQVFKQNLGLIQKYQQADPQATYGVTRFADLTPLEFKYTHLGFKSTNKTDNRNAYRPNITDIPASFDWREKGAVTDVKNQGMCGSCWAFSTTQNIEGQNFIHHNELVVLSEQQLVDCDKIDEGCNGGDMSIAFQWLADHGGLASEGDYPYTGSDDECKFNSSMAKVQLTGYMNISTNETEIAQSLVELGPLSIGVVADPWQFYIAGIANPWFCTGELDHGVLLVGYGHGWGIVAAADYWIVKNSWGSWWGESGYIRLERGSGVCGMNQDVTTSIIA
eukprot:CAMPEP_0176450676 /NCGR_PEP_ID=MMETSP0127-20121128/27299_1 /TAXON_ID=938130 /ORGANISM="Platyophrya macrostoma, Strain WH" /LENGTH=322 /DNA_ID=CAMNT_0017838419 /DNA_START=27 /DNA_END=995 /DNA_ORIENTATION=+